MGDELTNGVRDTASNGSMAHVILSPASFLINLLRQLYIDYKLGGCTQRSIYMVEHTHDGVSHEGEIRTKGHTHRGGIYA